MNKRYLRLMHKQIANTSVGPSTARGMGPKGTIKSAREFLARLRLSRFSVRNEKEFQKTLERTTRAFVKRLPAKAQNWGAARKFINIFLRGVVYNKYLCAAYKLSAIESWLELPLDSHVATGLREEKGGSKLPKWRTVIGLNPDVNTKYQDFAAEVAENEGIYRIHLDLLYWRRNNQRAQRED